MIGCLHPVKVFLDKDLPDHIKDLRNKENRREYIYVGCGHCALCRNKDSNDWVYRLKQESKAFPYNSYFITLTYDDDHIPYDGDKPDCEQDNGYKIVEDFLKRFRKNNNLHNTDFKLFLINELGGEFGRLHYHALFFGVPMDRYRLKMTLSRDWQQGFIDVRPITPGRLAYVAKYSLQMINQYQIREDREYLQKVTIDSEDSKPKIEYRKVWKKHYKCFFFRMISHGIGTGILKFPKTVAYLRERGDGTYVDYSTTEDGKVHTFIKQIPRYLLPKIWSHPDDAAHLDFIKEQRLIEARKESLEFESLFPDRQLPLEITDYLKDNKEFIDIERYKTLSEWSSQLLDKEAKIMRRAKKYKFKVPQYTKRKPPVKCYHLDGSISLRWQGYYGKLVRDESPP